MSMMSVVYTGGIGFDVKSGNHEIRVDLTQDKGGQDQGMSPPELFMASLGSCVGVYVVRYCQHAKLDVRDLNIALEWKLSDDKSKISDISVLMTLPHADAGRREDAIVQAAHRCLVHNTILGNPQIHISLTKQ